MHHLDTASFSSPPHPPPPSFFSFFSLSSSFCSSFCSTIALIIEVARRPLHAVHCKNHCSIIFVLFQIIVDRPQQVTESHNKNIEVIIILIIKTRKTGSQLRRHNG